MKKGKIINHLNPNSILARESDFSISFQQSEFGPYTHIFDRERLYFDETENERGSYFFPLKNSTFKNTEIFIERNDIVIALGERGSFSGRSRIFMEIVNLKNANKYRFYPDEVSLIYNSKQNIIIYYKKRNNHKKLELDIVNLEKVSEKNQKVSAFFKLFYNHDSKNYGRLIYKANSHSHMAGYFIEELLQNDENQDNPVNNKKLGERILKNLNARDESNYDFTPKAYENTRYDISPMKFIRESFVLRAKNSKEIDVWEASLTGEL